jgi:hypothetical protein
MAPLPFGLELDGPLQEGDRPAVGMHLCVEVPKPK